jgi:hypothetical protein
MAPRLEQATMGSRWSSAPGWTKTESHRVELTAPSGAAVQVEAGDLAELLQQLVSDPEARSRLPLTTPFEPFAWAEDESEWPGRVYSVTGADLQWVARAATAEAANEVADLLNRAEGPRLSTLHTAPGWL